MAAAIDNLKSASLVDCRITNQQAEQVFEVLRENISLKEVDLSQNCLSTVKPAVLARVINRLERANLSHCQLTRGQVVVVSFEVFTFLNNSHCAGSEAVAGVLGQQPAGLVEHQGE